MMKETNKTKTKTKPNYQTNLSVRLGKEESRVIHGILEKPIYKPYKKQIILELYSDRDGSDSICLKDLPINLVWRLSSDLAEAVSAINGNKNIKMLLEGAKQMLNAPHQQHFSVRLNSEEYEGFEKIRKAIKNIEKGT